MFNLLKFRNVLSGRYLSNSILKVFQRILLRSSCLKRLAMVDRTIVGGGRNTGLKNLSLEEDEKKDNVLFKFGIISDVQFADVDDRLNFEGSTMRYYRNAVKLLRQAVEFWQKSKPEFVLQLGDLVEGNHVKKKDREATLQTVLNACEKLDCYVCHLWGNHEFYLFSRAELASTQLNSKVKTISNNENDVNDVGGKNVGLINGAADFKSSNGFEKDYLYINNILHCYDRTEDSGKKYYFSFSPHPKFKFIALDSYDISMCGREEHDWEYEEARKILSVKNTNENWNSPFGLTEPHFVKFNGGISSEQLHWLNEELEASDRNDQNVIIISHIPLHPESTIFLCYIWNYQELLDIIWKHDCVKACICGHSHEDGDFKDYKGIQHIVLPAVLECNENENAFADVNVYENKLQIVGHGKVKSYLIEL